MKVTTYEATVEDGQIRLSEPVRLPEHTKVFVVVPGVEETRPLRVASPRLARPEQAADFDKEVAWDRLVVDPAVRPGKLVVKGTGLLADDLATLVESGISDEELLARYPELTPDDVATIRQYALVPADLRHAFGGWAEDAEDLERFAAWNDLQRTLSRRPIEP